MGHMLYQVISRRAAGRTSTRTEHWWLPIPKRDPFPNTRPQYGRLNTLEPLPPHHQPRSPVSVQVKQCTKASAEHTQLCKGERFLGLCTGEVIAGIRTRSMGPELELKECLHPLLQRGRKWYREWLPTPGPPGSKGRARHGVWGGVSVREDHLGWGCGVSMHWPSSHQPRAGLQGGH